MAALKTKKPLVWHLREFLEEDQEKTLWNKKKNYNLINRADKIITISNKLYKKYEPIFDKNRLVMIHNGIDANKFYCERSSLFQNDKAIFIFIGGFAIYKGHVEFARAIIELAKRGITNFEVWFIGTGNQDVRNQVEQMLISNGLSENYKVLGYRKDVE